MFFNYETLCHSKFSVPTASTILAACIMFIMATTVALAPLLSGIAPLTSRRHFRVEEVVIISSFHAYITQSKSSVVSI